MMDEFHWKEKEREARAAQPEADARTATARAAYHPGQAAAIARAHNIHLVTHAVEKLHNAIELLQEGALTGAEREQATALALELIETVRKGLKFVVTP